MKKIKRFISIGVLVILSLLVSSCAKENTRTSKMVINFSTIRESILKSAGSEESISGVNGYALNWVKISISDLTIEENSGNDVEQEGENSGENVEQEGEHNDGDGDKENNDVFLAGPYVLDVIDGKVTIDQVDVYPGTFKKVDFTFIINNTPAFGGNSIIVEGSFKKADDTVLPLILKSDFNQQVQLPLADGSIIVAANSTVTLSIVLDIPVWLNSIDLSSAVVSNNEILIDKTNNQELLKLFIMYPISRAGFNQS
jgi:hypothetical protein